MKPVLEGITKTAFNLENYDFSKREVGGRTRLLHISIKNSEEEENHYMYALSKINKTSMNYRCHPSPMGSFDGEMRNLSQP